MIVVGDPPSIFFSKVSTRKKSPQRPVQPTSFLLHTFPLSATTALSPQLIRFPNFDIWKILRAAELAGSTGNDYRRVFLGEHLHVPVTVINGRG